jgi:hypothetical protein
LKDDKVNILPVRPGAGLFAQAVEDEQTIGSVKSGARPDCDTVVVTELVREDECAGGGDWVNEYTDQIATMIMMGIAIFSHLLSPRRFFATEALESPLVWLYFDAIRVPTVVTSNERLTLKLSLRIR